MTFINASILAGLVLAGLPIVLHLMLRARPKRIEFPALRLLQSRQTANARRMRLRQILLLILRVILITVAVLAVTRPSLPSARYGLRWYEWGILLTVVSITVAVYYWKLRQQQQRHESAPHLLREKRARLRALSLLAGIVGCALAVGVPWGMRVRAEITAPGNPLSPDVPVAAVFVFDNSLSMTYKHESLTRLEHAGQIALSHLSVLPQQSRVAVTTLHPDSEVVFQADLAGARSRIEDLKTTAVPRSLNAVIRDAVQTQLTDRELVSEELGTTDAYSREVYILTDFSESAWADPDESGLHDLLVQHEWIHVYLIDVSVPNPVNVALGQLRLDRESATTGQPVNVSVTVSATAAARPEAMLELFTLDGEGNEIRGGSNSGALRTVQFQGSPPVATFSVRGREGVKTQRGYIRLTTPDPLPVDDIRYFTFAVASVPRVLLVGDRDIDTWLFRNALQPVEFEQHGDLRFECQTVTPAEFEREQLRSYDIVCVLNWTHPEPSAWSNLHRFVNDGGSLFVAIGGEHALAPGHWSTVDAQLLLPAIPLAALPFRPEPAQLNLVASDNSIVAAFQRSPEAQTSLSWALFEKSWTVDVSKDARVLMSFNDRSQRPALLERKVGRGRVLMFTSAMDNNGTQKWNESFVTGDPWAFLMLVDHAMQYLGGAADMRRNYSVGDPVAIAVPAAERFSQYRVARPRFRQTEGTFALEEDSILLTDVDEAGHYELRSVDKNASFSTEFAANNQDAESNLNEISADSLNAILGEGRYSRVTNPDELDRAVNLGRIGVEVFPVLMGLLILLFCAEHLMANYFYDQDAASDASATA